MVYPETNFLPVRTSMAAHLWETWHPLMSQEAMGKCTAMSSLLGQGNNWRLLFLPQFTYRSRLPTSSMNSSTLFSTQPLSVFPPRLLVLYLFQTHPSALSTFVRKMSTVHLPLLTLLKLLGVTVSHLSSLSTVPKYSPNRSITCSLFASPNHTCPKNGVAITSHQSTSLETNLLSSIITPFPCFAVLPRYWSVWSMTRWVILLSIPSSLTLSSVLYVKDPLCNSSFFT